MNELPVRLTRDLVHNAKVTDDQIVRVLQETTVCIVADAATLGLSRRATRDALRVITASYEYHGGFRLRTLSA